ncbi:protein DpdJ [Streptomyces pini]|uniref:Helicase conserved C-terminal domain-containing protein n=1 Tax=Streptomyces pini TaxID=1520580 RepID=A0A1I4J2K7_9ACTN|nr:protein DpdJ [Streptomyces pini]SFL60852.1 Helicase conserved C-terminal domain-containing protein [Streptomyces pini]
MASTTLRRKILGKALTALEERELPLLEWGVTDGVLSEEEVGDALWSLLDKDEDAASLFYDADQLKKALLNQQLLFYVPFGGAERYRTRFAEGVRLTACLRRIFGPWPGNPLQADWWERGKPLVADYRLHVSERHYPKREVSATQAIAEMEATAGWTGMHSTVAGVLIGSYVLSRFQVDATKAVTRSLAHGDSRGVVVGAGTGSGKTLAFYLPAFAAMANHKGTGVHTLALYPRIELLRDQLREAIKNALELRWRGLSSPTIGVLYGRTPPSSDDVTHGTYMWAEQGGARVCPYLTCPTGDGGAMLWSDQDRVRNIEVLRCSVCKEGEIPDGAMALTRESINRVQPKLLFTTTEMLNRNSTGSKLSRTLGWAGHGPRIVLLDEVHTYSDSTGAQTALLLRRWRHARRGPVTFVGLSATLRQADRFMAELVGLPAESVTLIEPHSRDMESEGREYHLALRGDPLSGTSLLSTTIQTAMLHGRLLDRNRSAGTTLHGTKGFLFTDDLDVTNRLYDDLRDAEGGQYGKNRRRRDAAVLAALRSTDLPAEEERFLAGQSWNLPELIGHNLSADLSQRPLRIGRTSSQDAGVDTDADLVVATASLEVGFNDPNVGLVVQHKAPRDPASFLQRRGRAGRERGTRPLTIVTLSDFGRDRLAYQDYVSLFAPEVTPRTLPVHNRHIIKIQGAQAFIDWLGSRLRNRRLWVSARTLATGNTCPDYDNKQLPAARHAITEDLEKLLDGDDTLLRSLANYLRGALRLSPDEVQALLWEQPRSLLLAVAPTLLRRLKVGASPIHQDPGTVDRKAFLPEFVTTSLFAPLNLPEVSFDLPFATSDDEDRLPVGRALREAVPGRVSRRFGYRDDRHRTWLEVPTGVDDAVIELGSILDAAERQGRWDTGRTDVQTVEVTRPRRIRLAQPDEEIATSSQGIPLWATQFVDNHAGPPVAADVPKVPEWRDQVLSIGFTTHASGNPTEVRRMTYGAVAEVIKGKPGKRHKVQVSYVLEGARAAMGFTSSVDAVRIQIKPLDLSLPGVVEHLNSPQWRSKAFVNTVLEDQRIAEAANSFQRGWLSLVYLSAFALEGLEGTKPEAIHAGLSQGAWRGSITKVIPLLYRQDPSASPADVGSPADRVISELQELSQNPDIVAVLDDAGSLLFGENLRDRTTDLARRAYRDTLAAAILEAVTRACPDARDQDLTLDVVPGTGSAPDHIWISETSEGGLGVVEKLAETYGRDPARFWSLVSTALRPNSFEQTDVRLTNLLRHVVEGEPHGELAQAMSQMRTATSAQDSKDALQRIRSAWSQLDGAPRHGDVASLAMRVLRRGSDSLTDATALALVQAWDQLEEVTGIEVDSRVIAYAVGASKIQLPHKISPDQAFSILWPRGDQARNYHLDSYQPYRAVDNPQILDRLLAAAVHTQAWPRLDATSPDWPAMYAQVLSSHPAAEVVVPLDRPKLLRHVLLNIPALRVDRGSLKLYGEVTQVYRDNREVVVKAVIKESEQ